MDTAFNPATFGYVLKNNLCLFVKGPLSQWWGGFDGQNSKIVSSFGPSIFAEPEDEDLFDLEYESVLEFNCAEQFMMAAKAVMMKDPLAFIKIMEEKNPGNHKNIGRSIADFDSKLWDLNKVTVVEKATELKFTQNVDLMRFLVSFNPNTIFAEAAPWDKVWGIGLDAKDPAALDINKWKGKNLLGEAIRKVRRLLPDTLPKPLEAPYP